MIIFTNHELFKKIKPELKEGDYEVFNYSSFNEDYKLLGIIPPKEIRISESPDYDKQYFNFIFNNDENFIKFMKLMKPVFEGKTVIVLVTLDYNEVFDFMTECLQKLILERYEIPSSIISEKEDFDNLSYESRPYVMGVTNKNEDEKRLARLCPNLQI